jgi:hypothetical protein
MADGPPFAVIDGTVGRQRMFKLTPGQNKGGFITENSYPVLYLGIKF